MIKNLFRALQIIRLFIKYDVDKMLVDSSLVSRKFYFYFLPWNWFRTKPVIDTATKIRQMLEDLGPIFVKLGQVISTRKDLLSPEIAYELSKLQDRVKPFPSGISESIITSELNSPLNKIFKSFDPKPMASASIAQVHAAKLHNDKHVIVKVVRPNIKEDIKKDIELMKLIAEYLTSLSDDFKRMHLVEVVNDYEILIYDETDLFKEANNAKKIKENFSNSRLVHIPEIYWDYVTQNVLVMERTFAIPINDKKRLEQCNVDFKKLAKNAVELFFVQVFEHNFFHADMHPGNIFVQKDEGDVKFVLVDFGIMGSLSSFDKKYLAENFVAFFNKDYRRVARLHVESEWVPKNTDIDELELAIRENCEPMLDKSIKDVSLSEVIINLFDTARKFKLEVQPQLVLMQKTLLYTEGLGREFYPELDLWKTSKPILEKWMRKQKGPSALLSKLKENSTDLLDILPDLPLSIKKFVYLMNNNKLDLESNFNKLNKIEKMIERNNKFYCRFVITFSLVSIIYINFLFNFPVINNIILLVGSLIFLIFILIYKPKSF